MSHKNHQFADLLKHTNVIPVIVINSLDEALPTAKRMMDMGYNSLEITLRTKCAILAIKEITDQMPELNVGAGTVLNQQQYEEAVMAGAKFIVSPGHTKQLLNVADQSDVPYLPGVMSPSEIMNLAEIGYQYLKFFPAEAAGGIKMLKSILGPFPHIKFCPTGGINF